MLLVPTSRIVVLTTLAMIAFAGNTVLARIALTTTTLDAASFTTVRLLSGAFVLFCVVTVRFGHQSQQSDSNSGNWWSAAALFTYAASFSFAYISLPTAMGALLLFGAVQVTMICYGLWHGERLGKTQVAGCLLAFAGIFFLFLPGLPSSPPILSALLMLLAGVCWGIYSLFGQDSGNPLRKSAGNFTRASVFTILLSLLTLNSLSLDPIGVAYAVTSGALTSGLGYVLWYRVMTDLKATHAAIVQLSVPVLAAFAGVLFLQEAITLRLILASSAILGGIALVINSQPHLNSEIHSN